MKRLNKSIVIPAVLLAYLGAMAYMAWPNYRKGELSHIAYFGTIVLTLAVIVALHFVIRRRERLRREREQDIRARK